MKLKTSYKKQIISPFLFDIEIIELPKPCWSFPRITESLIIDGFKYCVRAILYRHNSTTELILQPNENNVAEHNKTVLAKANIDTDKHITVDIGTSNKTESFQVSSIPHSYKEFIEKNGLVYECISVEYLDNNKYSIMVAPDIELADFYKSWFGTGGIPNL
jgi:hypothetical protein